MFLAIVTMTSEEGVDVIYLVLALLYKFIIRGRLKLYFGDHYGSASR